jgi:K+ transporter
MEISLKREIPASPPDARNDGHRGPGAYVLLLGLSALGVVYGDIGTSPIYALRECFHGSHPFPPTEANVLGVLSLIFWALMIIISLKYLLFVMRADNHGEGGILALLALLAPWRDPSHKSRVLLFTGLFGAALLYGDGAITPAISVLSAVEGVEIAAPGLKPYVLPITVAVLILLFLFQKRGTSRIGAIFGPVMLLWFTTLAHNQVLHEQVILLTVVTREVPRVTAAERLEVTMLEQGFSRVTVNYGFMQIPHVPVALRGCESFGLKVDIDTTTFYLARETLIPTREHRGMMLWREKLFALMNRNALPATDFFRIPPERVVELGMRIEI